MFLQDEGFHRYDHWAVHGIRLVSGLWNPRVRGVEMLLSQIG